MKAIGLLLFVLLLLILIPWTIRAQVVLPTDQPEYKFIYDRLERHDAASLDTVDYQLGPYDLDMAASTLGPFAWLADLDSRSVRTPGRFGESFRSRRYAAAQGLESLHGAVAARPISHIFVYGSLMLDESLADDPAYTGKKWRGLAGDVENAFLHLRTGSFTATLGRFASFWGPRRSFVLGPDVPMDGLAYSYRWGRLVLSYRLARLDGLDPEDDSVAQFENRYFAGHRLDIHLSRRLRVGFFETAIFGGPGRSVELYYLNPILFYHASQLNDGTDDNTFLGFDFSCKPGHNVKLYGQVLVDDLQIDDAAQSDQEPDEFAVLAGLYRTDLLPGLDIQAEYTRVTNRTFNQIHPRNRYLYKNELIGSALGNDYDLLDLRLYRWFAPDLRAGLQLSHRRQGEGRVDSPWDTPWLDVEGAYDEPFPTGTVERTSTATLRFTGFLFDHLFVDLTGGVDWIRNRGHIDGDDRTVPFAQLSLSTFFSQPIRVD